MKTMFLANPCPLGTAEIDSTTITLRNGTITSYVCSVLSDAGGVEGQAGGYTPGYCYVVDPVTGRGNCGSVEMCRVTTTLGEFCASPLIAYPGGPAAPGKPCGAGGTILGPSIGQVLDNSKDVPPGANPSASNEVNNNYYLTAGTGVSNSATFNTVFGIVSTTFNGEVWFTPELALPLYGGELSIRLGSGGTSEKSVGAQQVAEWIAGWLAANPSAPAAVTAPLSGMSNTLKSMGGMLGQNECYSGGAWNGQSGTSIG